VIVGLGNPGTRYERTRHNAGYVVADVLCSRHAPGEPVRSRFHAGVVEATVSGERCLVVKPTEYMNRSGRSVAEAVGFYKLDPSEDLLVVADDVALAPGSIRLRARGGTGGHNGLADIERALGTDGYPRLRVGVGAPPAFMDQADYVLGKFTDMEWGVVEPALERAGDAVELFVREGATAAMNRFNTKEKLPGGDVHPGWTEGDAADGREKDTR